MTSYDDLERAIRDLGTAQWVRPQAGLYDTSRQPTLFSLPFAVNVARENLPYTAVWRDDLDITAELSFDGPTVIEWLEPIGSEWAEIINISVQYRGTPYAVLSGLGIQDGVDDEDTFLPDEEFAVLPIPDPEGIISRSDYRVLLNAVETLMDYASEPVTKLLSTLGLRFDRDE